MPSYIIILCDVFIAKSRGFHVMMYGIAYNVITHDHTITG